MKGVDPGMTQELKEAADAYVAAPVRLRRAILKAAACGEKPAAITKAIGHVYTYDYVARLVREARSRGEIPAT